MTKATMHPRRVTRQGNPELLSAIRDAFAAESDAAGARFEGKANLSSPLFVFVHHLRGCERLANCDDDLEVAEIVEAAMMQLRLSWENFDHLDARAQFCKMWNVVKFPAGVFARAVLLAREQPFPLKRSMSPKYSEFVSLCAALQRLHVEQPIMVAVEKFAQQLGVDRSTITTYKQRAIRDGLLVEVEPPIPQRRAARFRFVVNESQQRERGEVRVCRPPMKVLEGA